MCSLVVVYGDLSSTPPRVEVPVPGLAAFFHGRAHHGTSAVHRAQGRRIRLPPLPPTRLHARASNGLDGYYFYDGGISFHQLQDTCCCTLPLATTPPDRPSEY